LRLYNRSSFLIGIAVIALGVIMILNNFGVLSINLGELISDYWPLLLVIWGVDMILPGAGAASEESRKNRGKLLLGLIMIVLGLLLTGHNLELFELDMSIFWKLFWPAIIIIIGWNMIRGASGPGSAHWAVLSGIELKQKGWKLEDGSYFAFMGGIDMDLNTTEIPEGETHLNFTAVMGGVDIIVPPGIKVVCDSTAVLGGVQFFNEESGGIIASRKSEYGGGPDSSKKLVLRCLAVMGGVEIKH
jgi:hypothetical protein